MANKIEFIIPAYERTGHLMSLIGSLIAQTNPNWKAHIVTDCPPDHVTDRIENLIYHINDDRIVYTKLSKRYNDWGHTPRNYGLETATENWIVMTGEDNYYMPLFVEEFLKAIRPKTHFVYSNMVHNLTNNSYMPVKTKIQLGWIDIGCCMYEKQYIKDIRLDTTYPESDYTFLEKYLLGLSGEPTPIIKIDKVLYVHN